MHVMSWRTFKKLLRLMAPVEYFIDDTRPRALKDLPERRLRHHQCEQARVRLNEKKMLASSYGLKMTVSVA